MRDFLNIGCSPSDENCVQVSRDTDYFPAMKEEVNRFKTLLEKKFPNPPANTYFKIKRFEHDFGSYLEVVVYYDDDNEESTAFAYDVEANMPTHWE